MEVVELQNGCNVTSSNTACTVGIGRANTRLCNIVDCVKIKAPRLWSLEDQSSKSVQNEGGLCHQQVVLIGCS